MELAILARHAQRWIDSLARAGQSRWQILPLGPPGAGNSPYQCFSAFAGNPALISPEALVRRRPAARTDLSSASSFNPRSDHVDYADAVSLKNRLLARAWEHFQSKPSRHLRQEFERFCAAEPAWLNDYALFMALRDVNLDRAASGTLDRLAKRPGLAPPNCSAQPGKHSQTRSTGIASPSSCSIGNSRDSANMRDSGR